MPELGLPATSTGRVLLVEDEQQIRNAYGRALRAAGFEVVQLSDGRDVVPALAARDCDVVICDIGLPGLSGVDVLRLVRRVDPDLPVLLMTAGGDLTSAVKAIELGALRYLLKPITPAALGAAARDAVRWREVAKVKRRAFELFGREASEAADTEHLSRRFDSALASLHMVYQPIVRWSDRSTFAYEALVRTEEPSLRRPDQLFEAAERLDRLRDVGRMIRAQVAETIRRMGSPCVFMNVHPQDLEDDELLSPSSPLASVASRVVLEVTERASLDDVDDVRARVATLRQNGFRLAVDDLGAGYSSLTAFAQLQPEVVKLDMSLVRGVDTEPTKRKLIESMTRLCRDLGMLVVAEGVESQGERRALVQAGCDYLQGYYFARPAPPFPAPVFEQDRAVSAA